jgi:Na+/alanine symporter
MTGLMVFPNLFALFMLMGKAKIVTNDYFRRLKAGEFKIIKA